MDSKGVNDKSGILKTIVKEYETLLNTTFDAYPYTKDVAKTETLYLYAGKIQIERDIKNSYDQIATIKGFPDLNYPGNSEITRVINDMSSEQADLDSKANAKESIKTILIEPKTKLDIGIHIFGTSHGGHNTVDDTKEPGRIFLQVQEIPNSYFDFKCGTEVWTVKDIIKNDYQSISNNQNASLTFIANCNWCQYYLIVVSIAQAEDPSVIDAWKQRVYDDLVANITKANNEISSLSEKEKEDFNRKQKEKDEAAMIIIKGKNSGINKMIINEELHKHAITMFAKEFDSDTEGDLLSGKPIENSLESFEKSRGASMSKTKDAAGKEISVCAINPLELDCKIFPVINIDEARKKGKAVQFLEQAFEWDKISYLLYPYFYGDKSRWMETYDHIDNDETNDTAFVAFLRAGYARLLVPVRDSYRDAVLQFLWNRKPWNGGSAPVIGDDLYLSIHEELRNQTDEYYKAVPEGEPWEYVLPTSLIYLQENADLPVFNSSFPTTPST